MKNFKKNIGIFTVLFSLLLATNVYAGNKGKKGKKGSHDSDSSSSDSNSYDNNNNNNNNNNNGGDSVPLDGGLGILLLGAAAFGAKKLRDTKK